ncbi:MAG: filamentous hemagglutinin N-terminal domain-containing protein [Cyanobacteria bacterium]|nr:filamentous hemagglutinin N-terminal domain-containing protein [Cyanobacteriota bacterium]MDW8202162.1 filamentous hemagglutinin N-terminal domain-containing protein [Cyanobacteriota bacterium SKYGB_h_bin112]
MAQVTADTSLGSENSVVVPIGANSDRIDGGAIRNNYLFHSLLNLNIPANRSAYFANPAGIDTIFTRITGGSPSQIDGTLGVLGNANLWLFNPAGVLFGPTAQIDLNGSLVVSTASHLQVGTITFSASSPQPVPLLTVTVPIGLGFGSNPAPISIQGTGAALTISPDQLIPESIASIPAARTAWATLNAEIQARTPQLQVAPGKTLTFVGGGLTLSGASLGTSGGQVILGSVAAAGTVPVAPTGQLDLTQAGLPTPGSIHIDAQSLVNTSSAGGGAVQVWGGHVTIQNQSAVVATTLGNQAGQGINLQASHLDITAQSFVGTGSFSTGKSGTLTVGTGTLTVSDRSLLGTVTLGSGNAGAMTVHATGNTSLSGSSLLTTSPVNATGAGGDLTLTTANLFLQGGARMVTSTFAAGIAGKLTVNSADTVNLIGASADNVVPSSLSARTFETGDAAGVEVNSQRLLLQNGGQISTTTLGSGRGGSIVVNAQTSVDIVGRGVRRRSGLFSQVGQNGTNQGGEIRIATDRLTVLDGAFISVATDGSGRGGNLSLNVTGNLTLSGTDAIGVPSLLIAESYGTGKAGDITLRAGHLSVRDGAQVSASSLGEGDGGNLTVTAASIDLVGISTDGFSQSGLFAASGLPGLPFDGRGDGGNLTINATSLSIRDGAQASASTLGVGKGGNVVVTADTIALSGTDNQGRPSLLFVATQGDAPAGDLTVQTRDLTITGGAQVSASTTGAGRGGKVTVAATGQIDITGRGRFEAILDRLFLATINLAPPVTKSEDIDSGIYALSFGSGNAGDLRLTASNITLRDGAFVSTSPFSSGSGGNIFVDVSGTVQLVASQFLGDSFGGGDSGSIVVQAQQVITQDGGAIAASTFKGGRGGTILVNADDIQLLGIAANNIFKSGIFANAYFDSDNQAGNIQVNGRRLLVTGGGGIGAGTFSPAQGGTLSINTTESVEIIGTSPNGREPTNVVTQSQGSGNAGNLTITTPQLRVLGGANISTATTKTGQGGSLIINAPQLVEVSGFSDVATGAVPDTLVNRLESIESKDVLISNIRADTRGAGAAGDLQIHTGTFRVTNGAIVVVRSTGTGQAGNLVVTSRLTELDNQGGLLATTASGEGGNIDLTAGDVRLRRASQISAEAAGTGNGGNITISTDALIALEASSITANAFEGKGGNIRITSRGVFLSPDSTITASSQLGIDGIVELRTLDNNVQDALISLSDRFVSAEQVVANSCLTQRNAQQGSFVVTGTGGLPPTPYDVNSSQPFTLLGVAPLSRQNPPLSGQHSGQQSRVTESLSSRPPGWQPGDPIREAQGMVVNSNGQVVIGTFSELAAVLTADQLVCHASSPH